MPDGATPHPIGLVACEGLHLERRHPALHMRTLWNEYQTLCDELTIDGDDLLHAEPSIRMKPGSDLGTHGDNGI